MIRALALVWLAALTVVLAAGTARAAETDAKLDGMYASSGVNPDGSQYKGFVHITHRGNSLIVSWMFPKNSNGTTVLVSSSVGFGIVADGMLAVSYYGSGAAGIVLYRIEEDGHRLAGHWTVAGASGNVYTETLVKLPGEVIQPGHGDVPDAEPPAAEPTSKPEPPVGFREV